MYKMVVFVARLCFFRMLQMYVVGIVGTWRCVHVKCSVYVGESSEII